MTSRLCFLCLAMGVMGCGSPRPVEPDAGVELPLADAGLPDAGPPVDEHCLVFTSLLQSGLDAERARQHVAHAVLGVSTARCGNRVVFSDDPASGVTVAPDALWQLGSATKTFIASTVLNLAAQGTLGLDDALVKFLPTFPNAANLTLRQLLSHTSGLFDYLQTPEAAAALEADPTRQITADELIAFATAHPPNFAPGQGWGYSNTNFVVLSRVIEQATSAPLGATVRAQSIARAGLSHTFFASAEPSVGTLAPGFQDGKEMTTAINPSWWGAAGSMRATPEDALDWVRALYATDQVLSPASKLQMLTTVKTDVATLRYGLGVVEWDASVTEGHGHGYGHTGFVPGYQSELVFYPEPNVAMVALVGDSKGVPNALFKVAYGALHLFD